MALTACSADQTYDDEQGPSVDQPAKEAAPVDAVEQTSAPATSFGIDARPVRIGLEGPDFDACGSFGQIRGLNPDGDNYLSVRSAPSSAAEELDRITTGTGVSMCETADGWIGVVYESAGGFGENCGVGSPVENARPYAGACRSGWISQRFVELIAG